MPLQFSPEGGVWYSRCSRDNCAGFSCGFDGFCHQPRGVARDFCFSNCVHAETIAIHLGAVNPFGRCQPIWALSTGFASAPEPAKKTESKAPEAAGPKIVLKATATGKGTAVWGADGGTNRAFGYTSAQHDRFRCPPRWESRAGPCFWLCLFDV